MLVGNGLLTVTTIQQEQPQQAQRCFSQSSIPFQWLSLYLGAKQQRIQPKRDITDIAGI
jgi:hypothetical protein